MKTDYDNYNESTKSCLLLKERGIRDVAMRVKQLQHQNILMMAAIMENNEKILNIHNEIQDEINISRRTHLWDDTPRLDNDDYPDIVCETGNNMVIPYFFSEYKHIASGRRITDSNIKDNYNFQVFLGISNKLERPAFMVSYMWTKENNENPIFFIEPMNEYADFKIREIGFYYSKLPAFMNSNGQVKKSKRILALSERSFVVFQYRCRNKFSNDPFTNKYLSDIVPTDEQKYNYFGLCDEDL
jgi:hypothetical protein